MQKKQNIFKVFKLIWKISNKKERLFLFVITFLCILRSIAEILPPIITAVIIAKVQNLPYDIFGISFVFDMSLISLTAVAFGVLFFLSFLSSVIRALIKQHSTKLIGNLNIYTMQSVLDGKNQINDFTNGEMAYIIKNSTEYLPKFFETVLINLFVPVLTSLITLYYIATVNLSSFLIVVITLIFLLLLIFFRVHKNNIILNKQEHVNGKINNTILNNINNLSLIRFLKTKPYELSIFKRLNKEYYDHEKKRNYVYLFYWLMVYIVEFACIVLSIYFALKTNSIQLLPSILILLIPYLNKIFSITENLAFICVELQQYVIKICRVEELLAKFQTDSKPEFIDNDNTSEDYIIETIRINNYEKCFNNSLCRANGIIFKRGKINCIIGESGSGKTTLIKCVLGLTEYDSAEIIINDNIIVHDLLNDREKISIAFQNESYFDRSITENISYPQNSLDAKAKQLVSYFGLDELIVRDLNENIAASNFENKFSGGEKKRISLCRVFSKDAQIYILDEPTNELDEANVQKVIDLITKLKNNSMIIVISHDNRIVKISDNIVYINNSKIN